MVDQRIRPRVVFVAIGLFDQGQQRPLGVGVHEAADASVDRIADEAVFIQAGQVLRGPARHLPVQGRRSEGFAGFEPDHGQRRAAAVHDDFDRMPAQRRGVVGQRRRLGLHQRIADNQMPAVDRQVSGEGAMQGHCGQLGIVQQGGAQVGQIEVGHGGSGCSRALTVPDARAGARVVLGKWPSRARIRRCPGDRDQIGEVAERFKAPVLKTGEGSNLPWVRIPLSPPRGSEEPRNRGSFVFPDSARRISWANAVS